MENHNQQSQIVEDVATKTASAIGMTAGYLQSHNVQAIFQDVQDATRRNPMPALISAATVGVLLGAFLRRG